MAKAAKLGDKGHPLMMKISKRFFVEMLTRDIELEDAILDLLDNCLDGIIRSTKKSLDSKKPYRGYWSRITANADGFEIVDNCGGIPRDLIERAFGIGRTFDPTERHKTIGIYGIGMKRAIFKMALEATVESHADFGFQVSIDEKWLGDENKWRLSYKRTTTPFKHGTKVTATKLRPEIKKLLGTTGFNTRLQTFIARHYAVIINKGFRVELNKIVVSPAPISILSCTPEDVSNDHPVLAPYMLQYDSGSVRANIWVGMYRKPPETDAEEESEAEQRQSSDNSGWTIICNDRAVVSNDTTILTGWGEAGVPRFHPQFIGIRGIMTLDSDYPMELPLTTTKRGLDASSVLFLNLKQFMREGTKLFTSFTNQWKADRIKVKRLFDEAKLLELAELRELMDAVETRNVSSLPSARRFQPNLPTPAPSEMKKITFSRHQDQISKVGKYLLDNAKAKPADVGGACFDEIHKQAARR